MYGGLDGKDAVLSINNGPDVTITFDGASLPPSSVVAQVAAAFLEQGVTEAVPETVGDDAFRIKSLGVGEFQAIEVRPGTDPEVLSAFGWVIGYVFADVETTNWMELRGPCGVVQDVYVDEAARRLGAGRALMNAAIAWIRSKGRSQVVLMTKSKNSHAQKLFTTLGFRPTMLEMTLDEPGEGTSERA